MHRLRLFATFTLGYAVMLSAGLPLGFYVLKTFGFNIGFIVNMASYAGAMQLCSSRRANEVADVGSYGGEKIWSLSTSSRKRVSILFALLAVAVDMIFYTAATYYFTGEFQPVAPFRYVFLALAYAVVAYVLLGMLRDRDALRSGERDDFGTSLVRAFKALSAADRSVLMSGLEYSGSPMLTTRGSANDVFWTQLSRVGWTKRAALEDSLDAPDLADKFVAWTVTDLGCKGLPVLIRKAAE